MHSFISANSLNTREASSIHLISFEHRCVDVYVIVFSDSRLLMPATNCEQPQSGTLNVHSLLIFAAEPEPNWTNGEQWWTYEEPTENWQRTPGEPCSIQICEYKMLILCSYQITLQLQIYRQACPNIFNIQAMWLTLPVLIPLASLHQLAGNLRPVLKSKMKERLHSSISTK